MKKYINFFLLIGLTVLFLLALFNAFNFYLAVKIEQTFISLSVSFVSFILFILLINKSK